MVCVPFIYCSCPPGVGDSSHTDVEEPQSDYPSHTFVEMMARLTPAARLLLCTGAKAEIIRRDDTPLDSVPVMQSRNVEPPQLYKFGVTKRVVVKCPCIPSMYIYLKDPGSDEKNIQVVLVLSGLSTPEPGTREPEFELKYKSYSKFCTKGE